MTDNSEPKVQEVSEVQEVQEAQEAQEMQAQPRPDAPGRKMLRVSGIVFIVYGCFGIVSQILFVVPLLLFGDYYPEIVLSDNLLGVAFGVVSSVFGIYMGIVGKIYCNNIEKAGKLWVIGVTYFIAFVVFPIVDTVVTRIFVSEFFLAANIISIAIVAVLPIIYLRGAHKNLKAWKEKLAM